MPANTVVPEAYVTVEFAPSLRRHVECAAQLVVAQRLSDALVNALKAAPELSHYVFDDQGSIRKHVAIFVNQVLLRDRRDLSQVLAPGDKVLVIQALSGG